MHSHGGFFKEHRDFKTLLKTDRLKFLCEQAFFGTEMCLFPPRPLLQDFKCKHALPDFKFATLFFFSSSSGKWRARQFGGKEEERREGGGGEACVM